MSVAVQQSGARRAVARWGVAVALAASAAACGLAAQAQEICEGDGGVINPSVGILEQFFPGDREEGVPIDGFVRLRYVARAPSRPFVAVTEVATGVVVPGRAAVMGSEVHWQADQRLSVNTAYRVHAADQGGTDTTFTFTTGFAPASGVAPAFDGITEAPTSSRNGASDLCGDPDAVEITVHYRRARDNGWPVTDVEYVVYQTAGPGIAAPIERARERGRRSGSATSDEQSRSFRLASTNAAGPVCFNVQALDAYGRPDGNRVERCVNPSVGNYFSGCARVAPRAPRPARRAGDLAAWMALAVGVVVATRRRR